MKKSSWIVFEAPVVLPFLTIGCGDGNEENSPQQPTSLAQVEPASIPRGTRPFQTDFLIFSRNGAWAPEVSSLKSLISSRGATYQRANQSDLNSMSLNDLTNFGVIIWTGGVGSTQMNGLSEAAKIRLR